MPIIVKPHHVTKCHTHAGSPFYKATRFGILYINIYFNSKNITTNKSKANKEKHDKLQT